jgi:hypothetical protein
MVMKHSMNGVSEKRFFERVEARLPAKVKDSRDHYGHFLYLRDFSAWGAQLMSRRSFFVNDSVAFDVEMPGSYPVTLKGRVVWVKKEDAAQWDLGVRFYHISLMNMSRLCERFSVA